MLYVGFPLAVALLAGWATTSNESIHPKGTQQGSGELRGDLKPGATLPADFSRGLDKSRKGTS